MARIQTAKNANRHNGRRLAFQVLYSLSFSDAKGRDSILAAYRQATEVNATFTASDDWGDGATLPEKKAERRECRVDSQREIQEQPEPVSARPEGFAWELICGVWDNRQALDTSIGRFVKNWRVERLGKIEITVLRLAFYELLYRPDVPPRVAISEAVDIAGEFGADSARSFINGILDAASRTLGNVKNDNGQHRAGNQAT